jgi:hypothetical protein
LCHMPGARARGSELKSLSVGIRTMISPARN